MTSLILGRQETYLDICNYGITYELEIQGHLITFKNILCDDKTTENKMFTVDGSLGRCDLPKSIKSSITRWLIACWQDIKTRYTSFCCTATQDDDGDWRANYYRKFGFISVDNSSHMECVI